MSRALVPTTVAIFSCPNAQTELVSGLLGVKSDWLEQSLLSGSFKTEVHLKISQIDLETLVSELNKLGTLNAEAVAFGKETGTIFMIATGLGIFRAETNQAGEIMLSEDRVRNMVEAAAGNFKELNRLLRLATGQAWDDLLEPFRAANYSDNVVLLNRAV